MSNNYCTKTYNTIDIDTGEIGLLNKTERKSTNDNHVKLFVRDIASLYGFSGATYEVLLKLYEKLDYQGEAVITSVDRERLVKQSGNISNKTYISTLLAVLQKKGLIKRIGEGVYRMNPKIFAKGKQSDIDKLRDQYINLNVVYSKNGRVISARVENKTTSIN